MKRWVIVLVPVLVLAGLIGWRLRMRSIELAKETGSRQARMKAPASVTVTPATVRDIVHVYEGVGSVESPFNVRLASKVSGRITFLEAHEGDPVRKGQVLVRIDPSEIEAQVRQQMAAVAEARARLAQAKLTQAPTNTSVTTQIKQQKASLRSASASLKQVSTNATSSIAAAVAAVEDAQGRVDSASASIANAEASVRSARANLGNAQSRLKRTSELYRQGFIAAQDVDDARTTVDVQQGALDVADGQLSSAKAAKASAQAQLKSAQKQADIVREKAKSDIEAARAARDQSQASVEFAASNRAQRPAYEENLRALRYSVDAAEAGLRNARAQLNDTTLVSPMDGYVTSRVMDPGAMATPGVAILGVEAMRQVWVNVPIPEEVSHKMRKGQLATVKLDAFPGQAFQGAIIQINPSADLLSRQFTVRVALENSRGLLKPGMFARATFVTDRITGCLVVPREAVQPGKDGDTVVLVDADSVAHRTPVTTGESDAEGIAILSGLNAGDKVVTLSALPIKDGAKVSFGGPGGAGGRAHRRSR